MARATFVSADSTAAGPRFRVQVASVASESGARDAATRALAVTDAPPFVAWNEETQTFQARVGDFATREAATAVAERLVQEGFSKPWVVEERAESGRLRLLETGEIFTRATIVAQKADETLSADGQPYRGVFEVLGGAPGQVTVVNVVNLEDYLRGVVPNELSPEVYPQIEALKAQAVAARTYALRNRGQFQTRGYDICASPTCQVYRGRSTEHPLSDRAVLETRGLAVSYRGSWINALYTSTCGGHTEDGGNIFEGEPVPYLRGVVCAPERSSWASIRTSLAPVSLGEELGLGRDAALLVALGILDPRLHSTTALHGMATEGEVKAWMAALGRALHRGPCEVRVDPPFARRGGFFGALVASLCWDERARRLLGSEDVDYLLQVEDRARLGAGEERLAAALLVQEGILAAFPDNALRPDRLITRAQAVGLLARAALKANVPGLLSAEFRSASGGRLDVRRGEVDESYPLAAEPRLFRALDGALSAASELELAVGDKVSFVVQDGRVTFLQAEQSRLGPSFDRTSRYFRWEVLLTPEEIGRTLARYGTVGVVTDVRPLRLGTSGRVVELVVKGSTGELVLTGLKVRWGLGLRENLFVIDRERGAAGQVERFIFTGKGWGHGVGLCQVGASGMAQAGSSYPEILKRYYTGIEIRTGY